MIRLPRAPLVIAALALILPSACAQKAPPPESYLYDLKFAPASVPDGAGLYRGDKRLAEVRAPAPVGGNEQVPTVGFRLPADVLLSTLAEPLTLRVQTPCGLSPPAPVHPTLAREAEEQARASATTNSAIRSEATVDAATWPAAANFWIDRGGAAEVTVTIGEATIDADDLRGARLFGLECAPTHPLKVGSKDAGLFAPIDPSAGEISQYLIAADATLCYREHQAKFLPMGAPPPAFNLADTHLAGAWVHHLRARPTYFMKMAPGRNDRDGTVDELTTVPCEPAADEASEPGDGG